LRCEGKTKERIEIGRSICENEYVPEKSLKGKVMKNQEANAKNDPLLDVAVKHFCVSSWITT
jgi:hypothetical protein